MATQRGDFPKALRAGVQSWFEQGVESYESEYAQIFDCTESKQAYEEDVEISGLGLAAIKQESDSVLFDSERQGHVHRYVMDTVALATVVSREMIEDNQYKKVMNKVKSLAFSQGQTKDVIGANVYNNAFTSTVTGGDGVSLLNSAHPNKAGGTWSNILATAATLTEAAVEQACIDIAGFTNDAGLTIKVMPQALIVPRQLPFKAERVMNSSLRSATANNDLNAIKSMGILPGGVIVNHFLDDPKAWFIRTNAPEGLKCIDRRPLSFDEENEATTFDISFISSARYAFGWSNARQLFGTPGA